MAGTGVLIPTREGASFDCYVAVLLSNQSNQPTPVVVLACSIDGVDADLRG